MPSAIALAASVADRHSLKLSGAQMTLTLVLVLVRSAGCRCYRIPLSDGKQQGASLGVI